MGYFLSIKFDGRLAGDKPAIQGREHHLRSVKTSGVTHGCYTNKMCVIWILYI